MPQNIWGNVAPEFAALNELNLEPIGSGPYKFDSIVRSKQGEIKEYRLVLNPDYYDAKPFIEQVVFRFYPDASALVAALNDDNVFGISSLSLEQKTSLIAQSSLNFHVLQTNQEDLVFFNVEKNKNLAELGVRRALAHAIDKQVLTDEVFSGFYTPTDSVLSRLSEAYNEEITKYPFNQEEADRLLSEAGWEKLTISDDNIEATSTPEVKAVLDFAAANNQNPKGLWRFKKDGDKAVLLTIRLVSVSGQPAQQAAEFIAQNWGALGVRTVLETITVSELSALINDRAFEAFVFGQTSGADSDIFPFWHSSQIKDGLNIASYKNTDVDNLLSDARTNPDVNVRWYDYREAQRIIADEVPAIPLYQKNYIFVQDKKVKGFSATAAISPSHRFSGIADWFLKSRAKLSR
jgi:peptide/nickel transport system substrate-binding protein